MKKKLIFLAIVALLTFCLGIAACGGKSISITFHGVSDTTVQAEAGKEIELPSDPVKAGYTFGGWFADEDLTVAFDAEAGVSEDTEVWAKFTANTDTEYTVVHLQQDLTGDTFTEKERETLTGTTDTQTAAAAKEYEGFTAQTVTQTNIEGDGSAVVEIRYLRNTFTVTLKKDNGEADAVLTDVRYGTSASILYAQENVPAKRGYDFEGWYDGDQRVGEDDALEGAVSLTAKYTAGTAAYTAEYYLEGLDGAFVRDDSLTADGSGTTDSTVTAEPKQIEHFTFDEDNAENVLQGTVAADGSLVLRLYYTRNSYTVTFKNGDEVLSTQSVKYEAAPVYEGETPEKEVQGMICLFAGFGEVAPVTADAEYAAQFVEVKDYNGYRFTESFTLPDLTEAMQGREYKQYLDNAEITAGTQTASVGGHTWKIALIEEDEILSEAEIAIEVVTEEEYYADYGSGDTDQFLNRFLVDVGVGMSFAYEVLDAETYGVASAYRYKSAGRSAWDQRLELRLSTTETDISQYDTVEFDIWVNSGSATFPLLIIDPDKYIGYTIMEKDTQTVVDKTAVQAGKWYHMTAAVPDGAKSLAATNICLADAGEIVDLYIRNVQLCKAEAPFLTSVGCKAVITKDAEGIAGRTDVYKYVSTDTAWNSRAQFTKETYAKYNALYENGGGKMTMDICFTGTVNAIQFWGIQGGAMPDFTSSSSPKAVWKDAEGNVVAPEKIVANTWYTLELDVNAIGKLDISNNDRGLQFATLSDNGGVFYIDNVQFIPAA